MRCGSVMQGASTVGGCGVVVWQERGDGRSGNLLNGRRGTWRHGGRVYG